MYTVFTVGVEAVDAITVLDEKHKITCALADASALATKMCSEIPDVVLAASAHIAGSHLAVLAQPSSEGRPLLCEYGGRGRIRRVA